MRIAHDIKPVTYMKTRAAQLLDTVARTRRPVVITRSGEPRGVLVDVDTYQELRDGALLLKMIAQGEADARAGRLTPQDEVVRDLRARLARK